MQLDDADLQHGLRAEASARRLASAPEIEPQQRRRVNLKYSLKRATPTGQPTYKPLDHGREGPDPPQVRAVPLRRRTRTATLDGPRSRRNQYVGRFDPAEAHRLVLRPGLPRALQDVSSSTPAMPSDPTTIEAATNASADKAPRPTRPRRPRSTFKDVRRRPGSVARTTATSATTSSAGCRTRTSRGCFARRDDARLRPAHGRDHQRRHHVQRLRRSRTLIQRIDAFLAAVGASDGLDRPNSLRARRRGRPAVPGDPAGR